MNHFSRVLSLLLGVFVLSQCSLNGPPSCERPPIFSRKNPENYLQTAHAAWKTLENPRRKHEWHEAEKSYNSAIAHLFDQLRCKSKSTRNFPSVATTLGTRLSKPFHPEYARIDEIETLFPAKLVSRNGLTKYYQDGIGIPLVGWTRQPDLGQKREAFMLPTGQPFTVTGILRFDRGPIPTWEFYAPSQQPYVPIAQRPRNLAVNWTAPLAFYWSQCALANFTIQKVLFPSRFTNETGLYFTQTYDPKKIPLVFIHGVNSNPKTFLIAINSLNSLAWFRDKYQVWLFNYPTGTDWLTTSREFRKAMNQARDYALAHGGRDTLYQTTIVAHSMGGLVTRASVSYPKTAFYDSLFKVSPDRLKITPRERERLERNFFYQPLDFPARVIFLTVPHKGSPMAERALFNYLSNIISLPKDLTIGTVDFFLRNTRNVLLPSEDKIPTGINTLTTRAPIIRGLQKTDFPGSINAHSIIGDFWKAGRKTGSDLVVPYWSSHINFAQSEVILKSTHSITENSDAILRISEIIQTPPHVRPHTPKIPPNPQTTTKK